MEEQKGGLLLVMAHPDDESMGSGGLVLRHTRAGIPTYLICATYGEAGWTGKPAGAKKEDLPEIRAKELEEASAALALSGVELWDYPDGGVALQTQDSVDIVIELNADEVMMKLRAIDCHQSQLEDWRIAIRSHPQLMQQGYGREPYITVSSRAASLTGGGLL